jgi:hypothetical protein
LPPPDNSENKFFAREDKNCWGGTWLKKALIASVALGLIHSAASAQTVTPTDEVPWDDSGRLYLFGDSRTDSGSGGGLNNPIYFNGRLSNGPLWWEYVYPEKTLAVDVFYNNIIGSTDDGINFAVGALAVLPNQAGKSLVDATNHYAELINDGIISAPTRNDTFIISMQVGGGFPLTDEKVTDAISEYGRRVHDLSELGAERFIFVGGSNSSFSPAFELVDRYNNGIQDLARELIASGATVMYIADGWGPVIDDMFANPALYSISEVPVGDCISAGFNLETCPDDYVFYEGRGHFTTHVNEIFGQYVTATQNNINYTAGTHAQALNTAYQVHSGTVDLLSRNALSQTGNKFNVYGFTRYTSGHANGQIRSGRANYSGYHIGLGLHAPLNDQISLGASGAYYDGDAVYSGPVGGGGDSSAYDFAANLIWNSGNKYAVIMGGAGRYKLDLTRTTSFEWRPTVESSPRVNSAFVSFEAGANIDIGGATISPFGRLDYTDFNLKRSVETGTFFASDVSQTSMESWQLSGGIKADVPLSGSFSLGMTGALSKELAGTAVVSALVDTFNYSYGALDLGRGVEARGSLDLSGQIWKSVSVSVEVGGRTGKLASDGYVQAGLTVPF